MADRSGSSCIEDMEEKRVRISDIAEELGLSTATISNVLHGKHGKASDETVRRVQAALEEKRYIPSMAGVLLAQNDSRIVGVVVNDHEKYEGHVLEDVFIVGFDDTPICTKVLPTLTSVRQDASLRARFAMEKLRALKAGEETQGEIMLPVTLVERESTAFV